MTAQNVTPETAQPPKRDAISNASTRTPPPAVAEPPKVNAWATKLTVTQSPGPATAPVAGIVTSSRPPSQQSRASYSVNQNPQYQQNPPRRYVNDRSNDHRSNASSAYNSNGNSRGPNINSQNSFVNRSSNSSSGSFHQQQHPQQYTQQYQQQYVPYAAGAPPSAPPSDQRVPAQFINGSTPTKAAPRAFVFGTATPEVIANPPSPEKSPIKESTPTTFSYANAAAKPNLPVPQIEARKSDDEPARPPPQRVSFGTVDQMLPLNTTAVSPENQQQTAKTITQPMPMHPQVTRTNGKFDIARTRSAPPGPPEGSLPAKDVVPTGSVNKNHAAPASGAATFGTTYNFQSAGEFNPAGPRPYLMSANNSQQFVPTPEAMGFVPYNQYGMPPMPYGMGVPGQYNGPNAQRPPPQFRADQQQQRPPFVPGGPINPSGQFQPQPSGQPRYPVISGDKGPAPFIPGQFSGGFVPSTSFPPPALVSTTPSEPAVKIDVTGWSKSNKVKIVFKNPETNQAIDLPKLSKETTPQKVAADAPSTAGDTKSVSSRARSSSRERSASPSKSAKPAASVEVKATEPIVEEKVEVKPVVVEKAIAKVEPVDAEKKPSRQPSPAKPEQKKRDPSPVKPATPKMSPAKPAAPAVVPEAEAIEEGEISEEPRSQKQVYARDFLLSLKSIYMECPPDMPKVEGLIGYDSGNNRSSGRGARQSVDRGSRNSDMGAARNAIPTTIMRSSAPPVRGSPSRGPPGFTQPPARNDINDRSSSNRRSGSGNFRSSQYRSSGADTPAVYVEPLAKSDNRWVPAALDATRVVDEKSVEIMKRKVRGLLNKLTLEKFDSISLRFLELDVTDLDKLEALVNTIFEKAVDEPKFAEMYARLCARLNAELPDWTEDYKESIKDTATGEAKQLSISTDYFRSKLVIACKVEFEKKNEYEKVTIEEGKTLDTMTADEVASLAAAKTQRSKLKRRTLGNIRFIGELFKVHVLKPVVMSYCINAMVATKVEDEIESVCDLLGTVGKTLEMIANSNQNAAESMDSWFVRLKCLLDEPSLSSRVKFKIQDILDLRSRRWQERERKVLLDSGPMTLDEVRRREEEEKSNERQKLADSGRYGGRSGGGRNDDRRRGGAPTRDSSGWTTSAPRRNGPSDQGRRNAPDSRSAPQAVREPLKILKKSTPAEKKSEKKFQLNSGNMFGALQETSAEPSPEIQDESTSEEAADVELDEEIFDQDGEFDEDARVDLEKAIKNEKDFEKYFQKEFQNEFIIGLEDSFEAGMQVFLKLRSFVAQEAELVTTLKALGVLVENMAHECLKDTDVSRDRILGLANTIGTLVNRDYLSADDLRTFLGDIIEGMCDMVVDVPGYDACVGRIAGMCILGEYVDFAFIKAAVKRIVDDGFNDFTPMPNKQDPSKDASPPPPAVFLASLMSAITQIEGDDTVPVRIWTEYVKSIANEPKIEGMSMQELKMPWWGLNVERLATIKDHVIIHWLEKYNLQDIMLPETAKPSHFNPVSLLATELKSVGEDKASVEVFVDTMKKEVTVDERGTTDFVDMLASVFIKHSLHLAKAAGDSKLTVEKDATQRWFPVLKDVAHANADARSQMEFQVIYTLQRHGNSPEFKNDDRLFRRYFEYLYETDVVSEATFIAWETGTEHIDNKPVTMSRGARDFLKWLKVADVDEA